MTLQPLNNAHQTQATNKANQKKAAPAAPPKQNTVAQGDRVSQQKPQGTATKSVALVQTDKTQPPTLSAYQALVKKLHQVIDQETKQDVSNMRSNLQTSMRDIYGPSPQQLMKSRAIPTYHAPNQALEGYIEKLTELYRQSYQGRVMDLFSRAEGSLTSFAQQAKSVYPLNGVPLGLDNSPAFFAKAAQGFISSQTQTEDSYLHNASTQNMLYLQSLNEILGDASTNQKGLRLEFYEARKKSLTDVQAILNSQSFPPDIRAALQSLRGLLESPKSQSLDIEEAFNKAYNLAYRQQPKFGNLHDKLQNIRINDPVNRMRLAEPLLGDPGLFEVRRGLEATWKGLKFWFVDLQWGGAKNAGKFYGTHLPLVKDIYRASVGHAAKQEAAQKFVDDRCFSILTQNLPTNIRPAFQKLIDKEGIKTYGELRAFTAQIARAIAAQDQIARFPKGRLNQEQTNRLSMLQEQTRLMKRPDWPTLKSVESMLRQVEKAEKDDRLSTAKIAAFKQLLVQNKVPFNIAQLQKAFGNQMIDTWSWLSQTANQTNMSQDVSGLRVFFATRYQEAEDLRAKAHPTPDQLARLKHLDTVEIPQIWQLLQLPAQENWKERQKIAELVKKASQQIDQQPDMTQWAAYQSFFNDAANKRFDDDVKSVYDTSDKVLKFFVAAGQAPETHTLQPKAGGYQPDDPRAIARKSFNDLKKSLETAAAKDAPIPVRDAIKRSFATLNVTAPLNDKSLSMAKQALIRLELLVGRAWPGVKPHIASLQNALFKIHQADGLAKPQDLREFSFGRMFSTLGYQMLVEPFTGPFQQRDWATLTANTALLYIYPPKLKGGPNVAQYLKTKVTPKPAVYNLSLIKPGATRADALSICYRTLGVPENASIQQILKAKNVLLKVYSPQKYPAAERAKAATMYAHIVAAYETILMSKSGKF